jgi:hypothetical protein
MAKPMVKWCRRQIEAEDAMFHRNDHVFVGPQDYLIGADGHLMPVRQPPPGLWYFKETQK